MISGILILSAALACAAGSESVAHPVFRVTASPERIDALRAAVEPLLSLSEPELVALVPDRTGFRFMDCPDCDEGAQEGQLSWSIDDPHHVRCRYCGMTFPNEKFPEDRVLKLRNPLGVEVQYPYWEDASGDRLFFSARAWRETRVYLAARAEDLGALYQLTGEQVFARRAALILHTFAQHYPGYLVSRDWPHQPKGFALEPPYPNGGGKWGRWRYEEIPTDLVCAYDSIYSSGELERLSAELGVDVRRRIEEDFFRGAIRQDAVHGPLYTNASPATYEGYAVVGRVLGDPALVHEAVRRCQEMFARQFFLDGFWSEGTVAYHQATLEHLHRAMGRLQGYSDPPNYRDPLDGERFDQLDLERAIPVLARANTIFDRCRYPDGRLIPFHDTGAIFARYRSHEPPERSVSTLFPGVGHAWLGRGAGADQAQFHLHFSGAYGHHQADNLNIALFAHGDELLPDIGYTHSRLRGWASSTLGHNTVLIDEREQYTTGDQGPSDGRLLAWETQHPTVQWMEAAAERAYPGLASLYRRAVMLVEAGGDDVYAVDLFRVEGGTQHDWVLHGNADHDSTASVSVPLTPFGPNLLPGVSVLLPRHEFDRGAADGRNVYYAYFQNVASGGVTDGLSVSFTPTDGNRARLRTHLPGLNGATAFLGDAPSVRRAEENNVLLDRFRMPVFLLRSHQPSTLFAAVHEPYRDRTFIDDVTLERAVASARDAVVLTVRHHGFTDHIVHRMESSASTLVAGSLETDGEAAFVRERDGVPALMLLWGGTELRWRDRMLKSAGVYEGTVTGTLRRDAGAAHDALVVSGALPERDSLRGATVIVTFGDGSTCGYALTDTVTEQGRTLLMLDSDPGVEISSGVARQLYFPRRTMPGAVSYRIRTTASMSASSVNAPSRD